MRNQVSDMLTRIINRDPLSQYSTWHVQPAGTVEILKADPNRPPTGAKWWSGDPLYTARVVPRLVTGRRIAVINENVGTIDALVVANYTQQDRNIVAVAAKGSQMITLRADDYGLIATVQQIKDYRVVNLTGMRVVGLTKGELSRLWSYAKPPQNL